MSCLDSMQMNKVLNKPLVSVFTVFSEPRDDAHAPK